ncbi:MAG: Nramp family divalent metal transporter [Candidatus Omnitrophica bacterium]|nr:Nramp family divalent metal transporter [Candidatus Omnitrophota bacterium]
MNRLEPLKEADLPERTKPFWKMAGPGAILVGLSVGAGEIIIWPRIVAEHGASMVWAAGVGIFLQLWVNFEVGRWTISTGETIYTGYCRAWKGFALFFILFNVLGWLAPGWGRASGLALKALLLGPDHPSSDTFWTVLTFLGVALLLFGPKLVYQSVERTIELLVAIITISLIVLAINIGTIDTWKELAEGTLNFGYKEPGFPIKEFFIALVFAGAGGTANLFYTFYLRDKQVGMGARIPTLHNPLRGRSEKSPSTGFIFPNKEPNRSRFKSWWRYVRIDQTLFFWILNSVTILLFIFASLAVLHPNGIVPEAGTLIWDMAAVLGNVWGPVGRVLFLVVGLVTLFSTQLTLVDGVSRSIADIIYTNFKGAQRRDLSWWYFLIAVTWMVVGCLITYFMEKNGVTDLGFLFNAAYMGGFAMAVYVPLTLYINLKHLPPCARPGKVCIFMMTVASMVYVGFAAACLYWEILG